MTYPDDPSANKTGLTPTTDIFKAEGKSADVLRQRLVSIGMDWFHDCQTQRLKQERQWYLNLAFFYGNQYVQFRQTPTTNQFDLYVPNAPYYRTRLVVNQVRRIIRKEISRLTAQKPSAFVIPASTEDADVFAAQAGEQIWDSLWRRLHFNKTLRKAVFWQTVCGNGYIKSYWDATKRDNSSSTSEPVFGDICIEAVTPFHIFVPDLLSEDIEEQPYVIHAQVRNISWIQQSYNVDPSTRSLESVDEQMQNVMGVQRNDNKKNQATVLEIWVKPGYLPDLPDGGMFTIAAGQLVQGFQGWPYEHDKFPFSKLDSVPTGKFYTSSIIEDLIPLQRELNRSRSQLIESKNKMSKPQLMAEKGTVDPRKITSEPGLLIEYAVGMQAPQALPLQNLPSYVTEEINRLYTDMSDISGQHEVSNGSTPPGVTAATAISFLQEQDESLTAPHYYSIEEAIENVAGQSLVYVKMYWDEERTVKIVGLEGTFDVQTFYGSDLRGNTDVRVESGSALPTSRAAKQAFIMDLMKMGFIPPEEGLELMEVGGLNRIYERIQIDKRQAQRENLRMRVVTEEDEMKNAQEWEMQPPEMKVDKNGLALSPPSLIPVHTYDNHELHIMVHNNYRKSQSFEGAPDITKRIFEDHVQQHEEALANQMIHPLTGMDPSDPNAPDPEAEEDVMAQQEEEGSGESTGPVPFPEGGEETSSEGMM
jgi:hypothetical protein